VLTVTKRKSLQVFSTKQLPTVTVKSLPWEILNAVVAVRR
jgi:hypothetical protein